MEQPRRRFQFGLGMYFMLVLWVALFLGCWLNFPYTTFSVQGNTIHVQSTYPMQSVLFDATFNLTDYEKAPEYWRLLEERDGSGGAWVLWKEFKITYQDGPEKPECMIINYPIIGYRFYAVEHTEDGITLHPAPMPENWGHALAQ